MYNSQYYTCEQIDQRLLQGYLDDYNNQNNTSLTKAQFNTFLKNLFDNFGNTGYYECSTAAATAAKAVTAAGYTIPTSGGAMKIKMTNANTAANATLNINGTGAKPLYYNDARANADNTWEAGEVLSVYYDGTNYQATDFQGIFATGEKLRGVGIDDEPTAGSNNLVKSGGVAGTYGEYVEENPEFVRVVTDAEGKILYAVRTDGKFYFGAGVPQQVIDYVLENTNDKVDKEEGKSLVDAEYAGGIQYIENPEFAVVWVDSEKRILFGVQNDGNFLFGCGVPSQIQTYIEEKIAELSLDEYEKIVSFIGTLIESESTLQQLLDSKVNKEEGKGLIDADVADSVQYSEDPEWIDVKTDADGKILEGFNTNGEKIFGILPPQVKEYVNEAIASIPQDDLKETFKHIEDPEGRLQIGLDAEEKIINYRKDDGTLVENVGIETDKLTLTNKGMSDFQKALKGFVDFSSNEVVELPEPKRFAVLNLHIVGGLPIVEDAVVSGYAEYYDFAGNSFKKSCDISIQGQTSKYYALTGGKGNYTLDITDGSEIKFGDWVPQDSFHLKGCANDVTRGILPTAYKFAYTIMEYLDAKPNRVLLEDDSKTTTTSASGDRFTDWGDSARCLPDGFPVEIYVNGDYWGLYSLQLKKHRKNYSMKKSDFTSFFLDADSMMTDDYRNGIWNDGPDDKTHYAGGWWQRFEIKNPKDLICMNGEAYDYDKGIDYREPIDDTSEFYDASNKKHKGSKQTKDIIRSFSTKYLEVKALIEAQNINEAKEKFNEYFDVRACIFVFIFNGLMRNADSVKKNTLWGTWENGKIAPLLWDLDSIYGQSWMGNSASAPGAGVWRTYRTATWPLALLWDLYEDEIKETYSNLRNNGIISIESWERIVFGWIKRVGAEAYERDIEKWNETPSYRKNNLNSDYWIEGGSDGTEWVEGTNYNEGEVAFIRLYKNGWEEVNKRYTAKVNNSECPVTEFYTKFPCAGGYYNSPKRMYKWMVEQIRLCDIAMGYSI